MASSTPGASREPRSLGRPGRLKRILLVGGVALVVLLAGYGVYAYLSTPPATLVIYTYPSLFGGACGGNLTSQTFGEFEAKYDVRVQLECPSGTLASALIAQKGAPAADVVIGLDEVTAPQADAAGVLLPYVSPALANISPTLVDEIGNDHAVTPYEWGYLGIDYCAGFGNGSTVGGSGMNFPAFAQNSSWARNLLIEDPTTDITGQEFLLWEIQFYSQVLHQDWRSWWHAVSPSMSTAATWDDAYAEFTCAPSTPQMYVSYLNDPAYAADSGAAGSLNSSVSWWNGTPYGWKTIYGLGIVKGSKHVGLDEKLIDWFLTGDVQSRLPTSEWEFPANSTVAVPAVFHWAMDSSQVHPLNDGVTPSEIAANLTTWVDEWQSVVDSAT
ncbi:MAG TPA: hypothetical protein VGV89_05145 [Thermoplasmata archaeon]|nr:hypothetical protein [Thermoplasmata archaeon]